MEGKAGKPDGKCWWVEPTRKRIERCPNKVARGKSTWLCEGHWAEWNYQDRNRGPEHQAYKESRMGLFGGKSTGPVGPGAPTQHQGGAPTQAATKPAQAGELSPEELERKHAELAKRAFGSAAFAKAKQNFSKNPNDMPGYYMSIIERIILKESEDPESLGTLIAVVEKKPIVVLEGNPNGGPSNAVGVTTGQVFKLSKANALGSFRTFVSKVLDIPFDEVGEDAPTFISSPTKQPLAGSIVLHRNSYGSKPMKKPGKDGKPQFWLNVDYERQVSATEMLKELSDPNNVLLAGVKEKFFPNGILEARAKIEQQTS